MVPFLASVIETNRAFYDDRKKKAYARTRGPPGALDKTIELMVKAKLLEPTAAVNAKRSVDGSYLEQASRLARGAASDS